MFVTGVDTRSVTSIGNGAPAGIMEQQIFYNKTDAAITIYDPYAVTSNMVRIKAAELKASEKNNQTAYYDQYDEVGVKKGRTESTFEITQDYYGLLENIKQLKDTEMWYAEGIQDDRFLEDATTGIPIFQEINFYKAKLVDFTDDKGDTFKVTGAGKFNTATKFTIIKGITPTDVTISGVDNVAVAGVSETYDIVLKDFYGDTIDGSDLTTTLLAGEITSVTISKISGTPTLSVSNGANDCQKLCTYTGTGAVGVRAVVVTKNGGTFYSSTKNVTVS